MVNTIWFEVDLIRFWRYFSVCGVPRLVCCRMYWFYMLQNLTKFLKNRLVKIWRLCELKPAEFGHILSSHKPVSVAISSSAIKVCPLVWMGVQFKLIKIAIVSGEWSLLTHHFGMFLWSISDHTQSSKTMKMNSKVRVWCLWSWSVNLKISLILIFESVAKSYLWAYESLSTHLQF